MPGFNGTGPWGRGFGSGRGLGPCGAGRFRAFGGYGFGRGFGWRSSMAGYWQGAYQNAPYGYSDPYTTPETSRQDEKAYLEEQLKYLEDNMEEIKARLDSLSKEKE